MEARPIPKNQKITGNQIAFTVLVHHLGITSCFIITYLPQCIPSYWSIRHVAIATTIFVLLSLTYSRRLLYFVTAPIRNQPTPIMKTVALLALAALAALTSASVLHPLVRQDGGTAPVQSIGTDRYIGVSSSPGSNCPTDVVYGKADSNPTLETFNGFGLEATMNFSQITVNGEPCTGTVNDTGVLAIMSRDELQRFLSSDPLGLDEEAKRKVVVAGIDTQPRKCGNYVASKPLLYFFTQEIGVFDDALTKQNAGTTETANVSGEKWMLIYEREENRACAYIDSEAQSLKTNLTDATPVPGAPTPAPPTPTAPPLDEPTTLNTTETTPEPSPDGGRICFPSSATVELEDGTTKTMDKVELGDRVMVADGAYSPVFMFTHKLADVETAFVSVTTDAGELALTAGHYIYVNGNLLPAGSIKVGDHLTASNGRNLLVSAVSTKTMTGLYNPQTIHGDIVVNGVRASTYTTVAAPRAAHALLAPMRGLYARLALTTGVFESGADNLADAVNYVLA